jgi:hypothetical protein
VKNGKETNANKGAKDFLCKDRNSAIAVVQFDFREWNVVTGSGVHSAFSAPDSSAGLSS